MRSLAEYERSLCPMCGLPRSICQDPKAELTLHAETSVCWATAHMQQAMKRWTEPTAGTIRPRTLGGAFD